MFEIHCIHKCFLSLFEYLDLSLCLISKTFIYSSDHDTKHPQVWISWGVGHTSFLYLATFPWVKSVNFLKSSQRKSAISTQISRRFRNFPKISKRVLTQSQLLGKHNHSLNTSLFLNYIFVTSLFNHIYCLKGVSWCTAVIVKSFCYKWELTSVNCELASDQIF